MHYTSKAVYEYISKQTSDPIVEQKQCRISEQDFPIYKSDLEFYDKISPKFEVSNDYAKKFLEENKDIVENFEYKDGKLKCKIPTPTLCPEERQRRRLSFRNERKLYKRKCDFVGNEMISIYSPHKEYTVYDQEVWWSDKWDALDYGRDFDTTKSVYRQLETLLQKVPKITKMVKTSENCVHNNIMGNSKNCYMCTTTFQTEDSQYCNWCLNGSTNSDATNIYMSDHCYQCVNCTNCSGLKYGQECNDCSFSSFLYNCSGCSYCFMCTNLKNKSYCFKNKQYTKEEYFDLLTRHTDYSANQKEFSHIVKSEGIHAVIQERSQNFYGNEIIDSKNLVLSFNMRDSTNVKYSHDSAMGVRDSYDVSIIGNQLDMMYETHASGYTGYHTAFSNICWTNDSLYYCDYCMYCSHCFGCVGLRNKEYCVFNKQYTKEEYNQLIPKLIAQMMREKQRGEFFDPQLSPFGYNETVAMEYFPLSKEEAIKLGYKRSDYEAPFPKVEKFVQGKKLRTASCKTIHEQKPELLEKLLNYAVVCEVSGKPFRIIRQEIDFYIKHDLPLPRKHPDIRHQERMNKRPGRTLYLRNCDKCGEEMLSVYSSGKQISPNPSLSRGESTSNTEGSISLDKGRGRERFDTTQQKIYCESCYQKEIYG